MSHTTSVLPSGGSGSSGLYSENEHPSSHSKGGGSWRDTARRGDTREPPRRSSPPRRHEEDIDVPDEIYSREEDPRLMRASTQEIDVDSIAEQDKHPIHYEYVFWFNRRLQGARTQENYEKNIKKIGSFKTIEDFWSYYCHLIRPNELPNTSDYLLFKKGIRPIWEDEANCLGGKWIVRLRKGLASRYWEDLVLAVIGEQFNVGDEICGIVISIRFQEDIISVWNRSANHTEAKLRILETLKRVLSLPAAISVEYKCHDASIKDNSSFRNTDVYRIKKEESERAEQLLQQQQQQQQQEETKDKPSE